MELSKLTFKETDYLFSLESWRLRLVTTLPPGTHNLSYQIWPPTFYGLVVLGRMENFQITFQGDAIAPTNLNCVFTKVCVCFDIAFFA